MCVYSFTSIYISIKRKNEYGSFDELFLCVQGIIPMQQRRTEEKEKELRPTSD